ncbi:MAG: DUF1217 domain-containing protein [Hyphomonadaceae bacterium]
MFQPAIPLSGYGGWKFLQTTYTRQIQTFTNSSEIRNDRDYLTAKLSLPITQEDFLDDQRLLRITMTAHDLEGEEWKRGFIDKVLSEVGDPESQFLARLNNPEYSSFADTFAPNNGLISLSAEALSDLTEKFEAVAFRSAIGEVDNNMRLSLNYQSKITELVGDGSSDDAILFRLLGSVPVRKVLETALNLPTDILRLPIERQADILQERLQDRFGINDLEDLTSPEMIDKVIQRFHAIEAINQGTSNTSPGSIALAILNNSIGFGSGASQNLFLSNFL